MVLLVFIPRGINCRDNGNRRVYSTVNIKINNNNLQEIHNVTVVFDDDKEKKQVSQFLSDHLVQYLVTPDKDNLNFKNNRNC